jgi:ribosome-associated protein
MAPEERRGLEVRPGLILPEEELSLSFTHAGGPGGQNVNKVATRATLRFSVADSRVLSDADRTRLLERLKSRLTRTGEIVLHASSHREQRRNGREARARLVKILVAALAEKKTRRSTRPTRSSRERRLAEKRRRAEKKRLRGGGEAQGD